MNPYIKKINNIAINLPYTKIMEVCGGHTNTIMRYGLRDLLPQNIELISGPGCPVCVTSQHDIDCMIELAQKGIKVATYGDMINVPGTKTSLKDVEAQGADLKMIYSIDQLKNDKDRVFFGIGFETTTPMTAKLLEQGFTVFSAHKLIPPALEVLTKDMDLDGFISPGHVAAITGSQIFSDLNLPIPQVISGFKPEEMLSSVYLLLKLIKNKKNTVINNYSEIVTKKGNTIAQNLIDKQFKISDASWRGMGIIKGSGLNPKNPDQNARIIYRDLFAKIKSKTNPACLCNKIVRGLVKPQDCPLFGKVCTPDHPVGACMVSSNEGACAISYKYSQK